MDTIYRETEKHETFPAQSKLYRLTLKYAEIVQDWNWGTSASQIKVQQKIHIKCSLILNYTQTKNKICICEFIKTVQCLPKIAVKTLSCFQGNQPRYGTNQHVVWTKYLLKHKGTRFRWTAWGRVYKYKQNCLQVSSGRVTVTSDETARRERRGLLAFSLKGPKH